MTDLKTPAVVAVIGAGTMGAGIAQTAAAAGHAVLFFDAAEGAADRGKARIGADLARLTARGKMAQDEAQALTDRITVVDSCADLHPAGLVIEAIIEDLAIKRALFAEIEQIVAPEAILASNTSSISLTALARDLAHPGRCVGMHFFNPAPVMKLVEVVSGLATDHAVADHVFRLARAWGKVPVHTTSTPGFIVNRVARPYYAEALRLCEEQVADPATLDALFTEGGGFRMGPFALMDLIGNDVNLMVTRSVFEAYHHDPRYRPSVLQQEVVNAGRLGRKSGRGFHRYDAEAPKTPPAPLSPTGGGPTQAVSLGEAQTFEGVWLCPTDGRRAAVVARGRGLPVIVHDLIVPEVTRRLGFAASPDVPSEVIARFVTALHAQGIAATQLPDWPGLVLARTVAMLANEGFEAALQGVADEEGIDQAMLFGVNYPRGPIRWARDIGLSRVLSLLDALLADTGDPRYRASLRLRAAAEAVAP